MGVMSDRSQSRLVVRLLATVVAVLFALVAAPAQAHTVLVDAAPGSGDEVAAGTELVALEFADPVAVDATHKIAVLDQDGNPLSVSPGQVGLDSNTVCARVEPLSPGVHTVRYEITAEDGHVLRNNYEFDVVEGGTPQTSALGCELEALGAPTEKTSLDDQEQDDFPAWAIWTLGGVAVLTAGLAVVAVVRSRRDEDDEEDEEDEEDDATE